MRCDGIKLRGRDCERQSAANCSELWSRTSLFWGVGSSTHAKPRVLWLPALAPVVAPQLLALGIAGEKTDPNFAESPPTAGNQSIEG